MGIWTLEAVQEEEASLEEALRTISGLKERQKSLAKISHSWYAKYRTELRSVHRLRKERDDHLKAIQSQLLVFESYLKKTKTEVDNLTKHKDGIIKRQHQLICSLALALVKRKGQEDLKKILPGIKVETGNFSDGNHSNSIRKNSEAETQKNSKNDRVSSKSDMDCLNDSDSAIMMEDAYDSLIVFPSEKGEVKVMRSVSDALEMISRGANSLTNNKNNSNVQSSIRKHSSLSSTPSGSSEDSDGSPSSTMTKGRNDPNMNDFINDDYEDLTCSNKSNSSVVSFDSACLSSSSFNSNSSALSSSFNSNSSALSSSFNSNSCISNLSNSCRDTLCLPYTCQHNNDSSTCQFCCHSGSTTPLVSPAASPSSSLSTTPSASPTPYHNPPASLKSRLGPNYDSDATLSNEDSEDEDEVVMNLPNHFHQMTGTDRMSLFGSFEKLNLISSGVSYNVKRRPKDEINPVTYNRVMSNHRSVTKPKDVKYKRINKAKSRSLEELRGKLKLYDGKQPVLVDPGQSEA